MNSKKILKYLLIAAVILIIFAIIGKKAGWFGKTTVYDVATEKVKKRNITEFITANGKVQPEIEVKITPDVSGEIVELYVKDGDIVNKGQLLLKINPDMHISSRDRAAASVNAARANLANSKARLEQVKAQFKQAGLSFERNKKLWQEGAISEADWESATSNFEIAKADVAAAEQSVLASQYTVKSAEASLKEANENLIKTSIYAPMSGIISRLIIEKGERVVGTSMMAGTEMLRIADFSKMEVLVEVNENDIVRLNENDTAIIELDAYMDKKFKGIVTEKGSIPFRPGMSASADIQTELKVDVLSLPIQSVTTRLDTSDISDTTGIKPESKDPDEVVFIYEGNKVKQIEVITGIQDNNFIEIAEGLKENDEVVVAPYNIIAKKLKDGTIVNKVNQKDLYKKKK